MNITFERPKAIFGFAVPIRLYIDGIQVAKLRNGGRYVHVTDHPCKIEFKINFMTRPCIIDLPMYDKDILIKVAIRMGALANALEATLIINSQIVQVFTLGAV